MIFCWKYSKHKFFSAQQKYYIEWNATIHVHLKTDFLTLIIIQFDLSSVWPTNRVKPLF